MKVTSVSHNRVYFEFKKPWNSSTFSANMHFMYGSAQLCCSIADLQPFNRKRTRVASMSLAVIDGGGQRQMWFMFLLHHWWDKGDFTFAALWWISRLHDNGGRTKI